MRCSDYLGPSGRWRCLVVDERGGAVGGLQALRGSRFEKPQLRAPDVQGREVGVPAEGGGVGAHELRQGLLGSIQFRLCLGVAA